MYFIGFVADRKKLRHFSPQFTIFRRNMIHKTRDGLNKIEDRCAGALLLPHKREGKRLFA